MEKPEDVFVAALCTQNITLFGTLLGHAGICQRVNSCDWAEQIFMLSKNCVVKSNGDTS